MRRVNTEGFVLKHRNFGDADRIYILFTKKFGKIGALAKGVRKITSRRSGSLDLLNEVAVGLAISSGMPIITEASALNSFQRLKVDLGTVPYGYAVVELLDKLMPEEEENREIYLLVQETMRNLVKYGDGGRRLALVFFQYKLLMLLGYDPILNFCASCLRDVSSGEEGLKFSRELGGLVCPSCKELGIKMGSGVLDLIKDIRGGQFSYLLERTITKSDLSSVEEILNSYLEHIVEAPLKSRSSFKLLL